MDKNIMETSVLNCYLFLTAPHAEEHRTRIMNVISEIVQQKIEKFFNK